MSAIKSILVLGGGIFALLLGIAGFNYYIDPQCYYRCESLEPEKRTLNTYYQVAQRILAHPQAEVVILGSSRGENTPPLWVQEVSGLPTLNLSASGAELGTKLAFLKIAQEKTKLRKVIWLADYFELISENADAKIKNTPALRRYLQGAIVPTGPKQTLHDLQSLIDHNTFEAALHFLNNQDKTQITQGAGSDIDYALCASSAFQGKETPQSLRKEVDLLYQSYTQGVIKPQQSNNAWHEFEAEMTSLAKKGVEILIVVTPYHPQFLRRLQKEHADIYQQHQEWIRKLQGLSSKNISVLNYFDGVTGDDESPIFWNDGVHFTCRSSILMLDKVVQSWKSYGSGQ